MTTDPGVLDGRKVDHVDASSYQASVRSLHRKLLAFEEFISKQVVVEAIHAWHCVLQLQHVHKFTCLHFLSTHFQVKQFQTLRRNLPETTTLLVCKNSLLGKAIEGTKFEALSPAMTGMNAFLFIHTEEVPAALKPYRSATRQKTQSFPQAFTQLRQ